MSNRPIRIYLTPEESQGYRLAGTAADSDIESQIFIVLSVGGMEEATAQFLSKRLARAAIEARRKITEATRYEIIVTSEPPSLQSD